MDTSGLKIGDFIKGSYGFGCIAGRVIKVNKKTVVIKQYNGNYSEFIATDISVNVTRDRISEINPDGYTFREL